MNKKFTKLMAALALLTFLAVPLGMRGQSTTTTQTVFTTIYGNVGDDENVSFRAYRGGGTSTPYATNNAIRLYQISGSAYVGSYVVIGVADGYKITSATIQSTSATTTGYKLTDTNPNTSTQSTSTLIIEDFDVDDYSLSQNTDYTVSNISTQYITFGCFGTTSGTRLHLSKISITYEEEGSLNPNNIAIVGAPVTLSFDLYNNASAQTISYTTSSTGAVTVSQSDYISATVNANDKTISVTPVAVTNGTQTITVSQAADDNYAAGSVTFKVEVADSSPATTVTIDDSGITNTDVYVGTAAGSLSANVTSGGSPVSGATVTWSGNNDDVATIASDGTVTLVGAGTVHFTASYAGAPGQYLPSSATYEMTVTSSAPYVQPTTIEITPNYTFWGKTGQFSGSTYNTLDGSKDNVSLHWTRGSGSTYANTQAMRFYKDNNLTFTAPEGYEIKSIVITFTEVKNDLIFDPEGFSLSETTGTWTGSSETVTMSRPSNADGYAQISKFTITLGAPIPTYTLSVSSLDHVEMFVSSGNDFLFDGLDNALVREGAQVTLSVTAESDYQMSSLMVDGDEKIQDVDETGAYSFAMPSHDVTITATATPLPRYTVSFTTNGNADGTMEVVQGQALGTLPSATASYIPEGYTFMGWYNGDYEVSNVAPVFITASFVPTADVTLKAVFAEVSGSTSVGTLTESEITANLTNTACAYGTEKTYNDSNDGITWTVSCYTDAVNRKWLQLKNDATAYIKVTAPNTITSVDVTISSGSNSSGGINDITKHTAFSETGVIYLNTNAANAANANHVGSTSGSDVINYSATIVPEGNYSTLYIQTNPGSRIWGITVTSGSASYSNYRTSMSESYTLTITGYGSSTTGGWNLIASPVSTTPNQVTNMLTDETAVPYSYDLYRFNQAATDEWENYHQHSGDFNIVPGTGYLYANKGDVNNTPNTVTLTFTGVPYSGDGEIELVYSTANSDSKMHGWNLVGNPFDVDAEISDDYYMMNEEGSELIANDDYIVEAMQGVFVQATAAGQTVIFDPQSRAKSNDNDNKVVINISRNRGIIVDRAVVRFGEGRQLPKMQLFENSTKLYITQDNKDYAVVRTEAQGEMPVSFRANENGQYTLIVNPENVEMGYLHLIDNMTGADINLLATPSYSFEAKTTDFESRFRLVFSANSNETESDSFAFFSNGQLIINNNGQATLQVIDLTGRLLSSETINGACSTTLNAPAGVYMIRLVNGENVKVQKIVVR